MNALYKSMGKANFALGKANFAFLLWYFISLTESMVIPDVPLGSPEWRVQPFMNQLDETLMKVRVEAITQR